MLTTKQLADAVNMPQPSISNIENDKEPFGKNRASLLSKALKIPEDVMAVYRGHLPQYAYKIYREKPDKLEKAIRKIVKKLEKEDEK